VAAILSHDGHYRTAEKSGVCTSQPAWGSPATGESSWALLRPTLASHRNLGLPHMLGFQIPVPLSLCSLTGSMIPGRPLGLYHLQRRGSGTPASILTRIRTLNQPLQCYRRLNGPLQTAKQQRIAVPSRRWSHPSPCAWGSSNSTRFPKLTTLCRSGARIEFEQVGLVEKGEAKNFHLN